MHVYTKGVFFVLVCKYFNTSIYFKGVLDDGTSVENASPQLYFGGLLPLTEYTAIVSTLDIDGEPGSPSIITFETGTPLPVNIY